MFKKGIRIVNFFQDGAQDFRIKCNQLLIGKLLCVQHKRIILEIYHGNDPALLGGEPRGMEASRPDLIPGVSPHFSAFGRLSDEVRKRRPFHT